MNCSADLKKELYSKLSSLNKSKFRKSFKLNKDDLEYINKHGLEKIREHCNDFVINRLSKIYKSEMKDGKQTPFKGHPVFKAQHATATCCRKCLFKWHKIKQNRELTDKEILYVTELIMLWITKQNRAIKN